jgi:hypothetical protein
MTTRPIRLIRPCHAPARVMASASGTVRLFWCRVHVVVTVERAPLAVCVEAEIRWQ